MISDALYTSLVLYDAVIDVEMMMMAAMKAIMLMVNFLLVHTMLGYDMFSGRAAMWAQKIRYG